MNSGKLLFTSALAVVVFIAACTRVDFTNPYDSRGSNYIGDSTVQQSLKNSTPTLTLIGPDTVVIAKGDPHHVVATLGASATDSIFGNLTDSIKLTGNVFTSTCSTYTLVYSVTNPDTHTVQKSQTVIVDCEAPVITLNGNSLDSIVKGTAYNDPGASAVDNIDKTVVVQVTGTVNTAADGTDTITYTATDKVGNSSFVKRTVVVYTPLVRDTIPPVITLIGARDTSVTQGALYHDPGATASDNIDGSVTVSASGSVNANVAGVYTITYTASDKSGNSAVPVKRTVTVIQLGGKPVITLKGPNPDSVKVGSGAFTDPGYSAVDGSGNNVTSSVVVTELNGKIIVTTSPGSYMLVYTLFDTVTTTRAVYVVGVSIDVTPPVITLAGKNPDTVKVGSGKYADQYSATDDIDGNVTNKVKRVFKTGAGAAADSSSFTATIGSYTITYTVSDVAGNAASPKTRTVYVKDTAAIPSLFVKYGVPLTTALPVVNFNYTKASSDGASAPNVSNINNFQLNWGGAQVYQFRLGTSDGKPGYSVDFTAAVNGNNTFAQASPGFTLSNSGFTGLDGSYYIKADATQCVWVKTDGSFAIIFTP